MVWLHTNTNKQSIKSKALTISFPPLNFTDQMSIVHDDKNTALAVINSDSDIRDGISPVNRNINIAPAADNSDSNADYIDKL